MELERRKLGRTDVSLTLFGFGGTSLGNMYQAIDDKAAKEALDASFDAGVRYVDTAPLYGHGLSEHRVGGWLRRVRGEDIVLSTKVGWRLFPARGQPTEAGPVHGRAAVPPGSRLQLRRRHAVVRGQPSAARHRPRRYRLHSRRRPPQPGRRVEQRFKRPWKAPIPPC